METLRRLEQELAEDLRGYATYGDVANFDATLAELRRVRALLAR